ncbi:hypothetical protein PAMP_020693 [Pampus punctatissimus]
MAKARVKISSIDSLAPPQPRSLRSRKREHPSDEVSLTDNIQTSVHPQDTKGNNSAEAATPLQRPQSSVQEPTMTSAQQAAEQQHDITAEHVKRTSFYIENEVVKAFEGQKVTSPKNDSQLESFRLHTDKNTSKNGKDEEEIMPEECNKSASQMCTDQLQVFLSTSEEGDESCVTALEEQLGAREISHSDLKRNQETSQDESSQDVCMVDVKEITKVAVARLPVKKKRRMGMCGLTEKERSHFLQTQKREKVQNGLERVERQMYNNKDDLSAQEEIISSLSLPSSPPTIAAASVTEPRETEIILQSSHCERVDRAESEDSTSDGISTVCDPGCSEGKSCEAERGPEQTSDSQSDLPVEEEEAHLGNPEQQELEGSTAEIMAEIHKKQMKDELAEVETCYSYQSQNEETEKQKDGREAAPQLHCVTITRDEKKEGMTGDAEDSNRAKAGASSTDTQREEFNCGSEELCQAAVTPGGSERKRNCGPDDKPATSSSTMNAEDPQTRDTTGPFGSGCLDYVSDSQLNAIVWTEEVVMDKDRDEDATDLICGLIRELSSLNRTVMATHREIENLRRGSKSSRSSAC